MKRSVKTVKNRERIIAEVHGEFDKKRITNAMISKFVFMTMFYVYSSDNDLIKTLKAHPISPSTTKWVMCYKIIIDFLKKNKMYSTIKAIDQELFEYDVTSKEILAHHPKKYKKLMPEGSSQYLETLCKKFDVGNSTYDSINVDSLVDSRPTNLPDRNYYPLFDPKTG